MVPEYSGFGEWLFSLPAGVRIQSDGSVRLGMIVMKM